MEAPKCHQLTEQPTDEALQAAFARCVQPPRREIYPAIREAIATYFDDESSAWAACYQVIADEIRKTAHVLQSVAS